MITAMNNYKNLEKLDINIGISKNFIPNNHYK